MTLSTFARVKTWAVFMSSASTAQLKHTQVSLNQLFAHKAISFILAIIMISHHDNNCELHKMNINK